MSMNSGWGAGEMEGSFEAFDQQEAYGANGEASYEMEGNGLHVNPYGEAESPYGEAEQEAEGVFDETEEMELASDLLSLGSEAELNQAIGELMHRAAHAVGGSHQSRCRHGARQRPQDRRAADGAPPRGAPGAGVSAAGGPGAGVLRRGEGPPREGPPPVKSSASRRKVSAARTRNSKSRGACVRFAGAAAGRAASSTARDRSARHRPIGARQSSTAMGARDAATLGPAVSRSRSVSTTLARLPISMGRTGSRIRGRIPLSAATLSARNPIRRRSPGAPGMEGAQQPAPSFGHGWRPRRCRRHA